MRSVLRERNAQAGRLLEKVLEEDTDKTLISFIRMSREDFQYLLSWITPKIRKQDTNMPPATTTTNKSTSKRKQPAAGDCYNTHELNYRVSKQFELMIIN
uniref:Uncharacterized protein n=1 Tax=Anopheles triannulatus TaxID=58253 RepID=A0A2M4AYW8_9DIPT